MGIGFNTDAVGIGIPTSGISVLYRGFPVPDCVPFFRYRTGFGIGIFVHSGIGLTGCPPVRHSGILKCWQWQGIHPRVHNAVGGKELHV
jgi:hypothetical protein